MNYRCELKAGEMTFGIEIWELLFVLAFALLVLGEFGRRGRKRKRLQNRSWRRRMRRMLKDLDLPND